MFVQYEHEHVPFQNLWGELFHWDSVLLFLETVKGLPLAFLQLKIFDGGSVINAMASHQYTSKFRIVDRDCRTNRT